MPSSCEHSAEFHILIWLGFEYGTFCVQGELSTPHQRVIIGSLWSTWRLRAQRKQLSLHPTLDCLSQQTPFPSPLPAFSSEFSLSAFYNLTMAHRTKGTADDHIRSFFSEHTLPLDSQPCGWGKACVLSRFCLVDFSAADSRSCSPLGWKHTL